MTGTSVPSDWLIHQQFAQMIDLAMGYPVTEEDLFDFTDKPPIVHLETSLYPYHYVAVAALNGVVVAYGDGTFRPLYRERRNEAIEAAVRAEGEPPRQPADGYTGHLTDADAVIGRSLAHSRIQRTSRQHRRARRDPGELGPHGTRHPGGDSPVAVEPPGEGPPSDIAPLDRMPGRPTGGPARTNR